MIVFAVAGEILARTPALPEAKSMVSAGVSPMRSSLSASEGT